MHKANGIMKQGYLLKQSLYLKTNRKRWVVLEGQRIDCYKDDDNKAITESFDLNTYNEISATATDCCFKLISSQNMRLFTAESAQEMMQWIQNIENVQNELKLHRNVKVDKIQNEQQQKIQIQPPSFHQHHTQKTTKKYSHIPTQTAKISDDESETSDLIDDKFDNTETRQINVDDTVSELLSLQPNSNKQQINETKNEPKQTTIRRSSTMQRITTFRQQSVQRTSTGFENIMSGVSNIGMSEIMIIVAVIFLILSFMSPMYGICGGSALSDLWDDCDMDSINIDCNDTYLSQFTWYNAKTRNSNSFTAKRRKRKSFGDAFTAMIVLGSIEMTFFFVMCCVCCCIKLNVSWYSNSEAASLFLMCACSAALIFSIGWFSTFIQCIKFRGIVLMHCDDGTLIYDGTMDIFSWFYPLCVFEIVKGSIMATVVCFWLFYEKCIKSD